MSVPLFRIKPFFERSKEEYDKLSATRIGSDLLAIRGKLKCLKREADDFIKDMLSFSFYEFERDFITAHELFKRRRKLHVPKLQQPVSQHDFDYAPYLKRFSIFKEDHLKPGTISIVYFTVIKLLIQEQRLGTVLSYQDSYNSIKKIRGNVCFTDITVTCLHQYEQWMKKEEGQKLLLKSNFVRYGRSLTRPTKWEWMRSIPAALYH